MNASGVFSAIQLIAEKRIEAALEKGEFDNLPGSGRPLEFEDMNHIPEELRMTYKILRNSNCLPPELADRKEISGLADMLKYCNDEQERLRQMQKLRYMITRAQMRHNRSILLEINDPYYERLLARLNQKT